MGQTRFQKVEQRHLVELNGGAKALAVGLHIIHEVTSSQAFAALKKMGVPVHRPENTFAVTDHVVNTGGSSSENDIMDEILIKTLEENCSNNNITLYGQHNGLQG
ncbi:MAG: 3-isopropylmalate dehydratase large subunit, partial [Planctomycetes bacterium]|nr:3-isopropylmalate dehydratase large subunit [Planctomycetota bacterium]